MADFLQDAAEWLQGVREDSFAGDVTYRRDDAETVVTATRAQTEAEIDDESGLRVRVAIVDFLIAAADLAEYGEPVAGDRILCGERLYEVLPLGAAGHWRWSDPYRLVMRIHTKDVGPEDGGT